MPPIDNSYTDESCLPAMMPMLYSAACCLQRDASTSATTERSICKDHFCICALPSALCRSCQGASQQQMHVCSRAPWTDLAMECRRSCLPYMSGQQWLQDQCLATAESGGCSPGLYLPLQVQPSLCCSQCFLHTSHESLHAFSFSR